MIGMAIKGRYHVEHYGEDGVLKGTYDFPNGIVDEGLNHILDTQFHNTAQVGTWYLGLVNNSGWSSFSNSDTMATHTGRAESADYTEAVRQEWTEGAAAPRSIARH